jgi:DNA-binding transcriptional LysR family regulator
MLPTARAEALRVPLHDALERLQGLMREQLPFDAATASGSFRLAGSDYALRVLPLAAAIAGPAPGMRLALLAFDAQRAWAQLEADEVDLVLASERLTPKGAQARRLFEEQLVFVQRRGHPRGAAAPTLAEFCGLDHILVSPEGGGFRGAADAALARLGRARRVAVSLPSFLLVPPLVQATDLVALVPRRLAALFGETLQAFAPPLELPGFAVLASWHQRRQRDPAHAWLRERVVAAAALG